MRIGVIQASSQKEKNTILAQCVTASVNPDENEVVNFGVFENDGFACSYIETAFAISALLESGAVDFIVTGCSSGQGMMLACNSLPGVLCGYVESPADAYLFGRINDGNAVSYPLGLRFGWAGEIDLQSTIRALFQAPFGIGYPSEDAARKRRDTKQLKQLNRLTKKTLLELLPLVDRALLVSLQKRKNVYDYLLANGTDRTLIGLLVTLLA